MQGLIIVALGNISKTSYSAIYLVLKSTESLSGEAPAAEKWISLLTSGLLAHALATLLAIFILMCSASYKFLIFLLGPTKFTTTLEFYTTLSKRG